MTNLLKETRDAITRSGHAIEDIVFIGSANGEYACTWQEFEQIADVEYDSGFGAAEVARDLVVRFSDSKHLWRYEYDGSERWDWDTPPQGQWEGAPKPIVRLAGGMWSSVADLQEEAPDA